MDEYAQSCMRNLVLYRSHQRSDPSRKSSLIWPWRRICRRLPMSSRASQYFQPCTQNVPGFAIFFVQRDGGSTQTCSVDGVAIG